MTDASRVVRFTDPLGRPTPAVALLGTMGATLLMGSCTDPSGPVPVREIGFIGAAAVEDVLPVTGLQAGMDNVVTVYTFGSSSCTTPDDVEVIALSNGYVLTPYDLVGPPPGTNACTDDLAPHAHQLTLHPTETGAITVYIRGLTFDGGERVETTVEREVIVR